MQLVVSAAAHGHGVPLDMRRTRSEYLGPDAFDCSAAAGIFLRQPPDEEEDEEEEENNGKDDDDDDGTDEGYSE